MNRASRLTYIDYAKAIAMFWIIHTHLLQPYNNDSYIGVFGHLLGLPTFFFLSGYLLATTLEHHTDREILRIRLIDLGATYIIWTLILTIWNCIVDYCRMGRLEILSKISYAGLEMWFFLNLLGAVILIIACRRIRISSLLVVAVLAILSFMLLMGLFPISGRMPGKILLNSLIVYQGYLFRGWNKRRALLSVILLILGLIFLYIYGITEMDCNYSSGIRLVVFEGSKVLYCYLWPALFYLIHEVIDGNMLGIVLTSIGRSTKYIYAIHMGLVYVLNNVLNTCRLWMIPKILLCIMIPLLIEHLIRGTKVDALLFNQNRIGREGL